MPGERVRADIFHPVFGSDFCFLAGIELLRAGSFEEISLNPSRLRDEHHVAWLLTAVGVSVGYAPWEEDRVAGPRFKIVLSDSDPMLTLDDFRISRPHGGADGAADHYEEE